MQESHYRKYFNFFDKVPNIDKIFKNYDVILTNPIKCGSIPMEYGYYHNINDLMAVKDIIQKIKDLPSLIFESFSNILESIRQKIIDLKDKLNELPNLIYENFSTILDNIKNGLSTLKDKILDLPSQIYNFFKDVIDSIKNKIIEI